MANLLLTSVKLSLGEKVQFSPDRSPSLRALWGSEDKLYLNDVETKVNVTDFATIVAERGGVPRSIFEKGLRAFAWASVEATGGFWGPREVDLQKDPKEAISLEFEIRRLLGKEQLDLELLSRLLCRYAANLVVGKAEGTDGWFQIYNSERSKLNALMETIAVSYVMATE